MEKVDIASVKEKSLKKKSETERSSPDKIDERSRQRKREPLAKRQQKEEAKKKKGIKKTKKILSFTNSGGQNRQQRAASRHHCHQIKMATKVRTKYQSLTASTIACFNKKETTDVINAHEEREGLVAVAEEGKMRKLKSVTVLEEEGANRQMSMVDSGDINDLAIMFAKLRITDARVPTPVSRYCSRQNLDADAQQQIGCVLQQIRLEMAVSQELAGSLRDTSLNGNNRTQSAASSDGDNNGDGCNALLSDEEYFAKRRKYSNKERNFS